MKKALFLICSLLLALPAFAAEPEIKPFGGLQWTDGLLEAAARMQRFKPASLKLRIAKGRRDAFEADLKLDDGPDAVKKALKTLLEKKFANTEAMRTTAYLDKDRKDENFLNDYCLLVADPINIKGVPFKLTVTLQPHQALGVLKPEQVFELKIKGKKLAFPLRVISAVLYSSDDALVGKYRQIGEPLYEKYKPYAFGPFWQLSKDGVLKGEVSKDGYKLKVDTAFCRDPSYCSFKASMNLTYSSNDRFKLDKVYGKHEAGPKKEKMMERDAPDMGDAL